MDDLQKKLGYRFRDEELLRSALTHKSYNEGGRNRGLDNERLEFLGDSVIGMVITDYIYRRCRDNSEGDLAKMRAHLVSSNLLFKVAKSIGLGSYLQLGRGEEKNQGRRNPKIVSSCLEALVGAIYLDSDLPAVAAVVIALFKEYLEQLLSQEMRINDYKSELQELIQKHRNILPSYKVVAENGKPPDTRFKVAVFLENSEIGSGWGKNRREAEQEAALIALKNIGNFIHFERLSDTFFAEKPKGQ
ncbi:MAG: ribonuclease III [Candidatus Aminicenantes bacterium]|nr:ribonuclease III [Candidatus Aminicenantes bacterium]